MALNHKCWSRRRLIKAAISSAAAASTIDVVAQSRATVAGFDHVALPLQNTDAMLAFYRALGLRVVENTNAVSVYLGPNMINFQRPLRWQDPTFTLRAPAAKPPCGDMCVVWDGTWADLKTNLDRAGARIEVGPVDRPGGRQKTGSSTYLRDPDGNLLEFMIYTS